MQDQKVIPIISVKNLNPGGILITTYVVPEPDAAPARAATAALPKVYK